MSWPLWYGNLPAFEMKFIEFYMFDKNLQSSFDNLLFPKFFRYDFSNIGQHSKGRLQKKACVVCRHKLCVVSQTNVACFSRNG